MSGNIEIIAHIEQLTNEVEALRKEKIRLTLETRKQQVLILELRRSANDLKAEMDCMKADVAFAQSQERIIQSRCDDDTQRLMRRIKSLEQNLEVRDKCHNNEPTPRCTCGGLKRTKDDKILKEKLRKAVNYIGKLALEKKQLIDAHNRYMADARDAKQQSSLPNSHHPLSQKISNKLEGLQRLHYQLELQALMEQKQRELQQKPPLMMDKEVQCKMKVDIVEKATQCEERPSGNLSKEKSVDGSNVAPLSPTIQHNLIRSVSSAGSLSNIWKLLDESGFSDGHFESPRGHFESPKHLAVKGASAPVQQRRTAQISDSRKFIIGPKVNPKPKRKVRNYNLRDGDSKD